MGKKDENVKTEEQKEKEKKEDSQEEKKDKKSKVEKSKGDLKIFWPKVANKPEVNSAFRIRMSNGTIKDFKVPLKRGEGLVSINLFKDISEINSFTEQMSKMGYVVNNDQARAHFTPKDLNGLWICLSPEFNVKKALDKEQKDETTLVINDQTLVMTNQMIKTSDYNIKEALKEKGFLILG